MKNSIILTCLFFFLIFNIEYSKAQTQSEIEKVVKEEPVSKSKKEKKAKVPKQKKEKSKKEKKNRELSKKKIKNKKTNEISINSLNNASRNKLNKIGNKLANNGSYYNALDYYKAALFKSKKDKHKINYSKQLADANYFLRDYKQAEKYYTQAIKLNSNHKKYPLLEYQLANTYKYLAKYDTAISLYSRFTRLQSENDKISNFRKKARLEKKGSEYALDLKNDNSIYEVENAGDNVNGPFSDYGPELLNDKLFFSKIYSDKVIVLDDDIREKDFSKIYFSEHYDDKFNVFQDFSDNINQNQYHVGNPSFTSDGNTVYYTECTLDNEMKSICKIMKSDKSGSDWSKPSVMNNNINVEGTNTTQPQISVSPAGKERLFFVSNRERSKGGKDIWYCDKDEDGNFTRAKNLGYPFNTSFDEISPFYHTASNTLYFSSNGHVNIGGFDVFKVENYFQEDDDEDREVINLGYPINSSLDDYDFVLNNNEDLGFLSSNRIGTTSLKSETCCDDIYVIKSTKIDLFVTGLVYAENETSRDLYHDADLFLYNKETNELINQLEYKNGQAFIEKIEKDMNYKIVGISDDFENEEISFSTLGLKKSDTLQYNIFLKERNLIEFVIGKIYYQFDESKLREDAPETLRKVITFMNAYPDVIVEVGSHTDSKGTEEYNLELSERRSLSVKNYLIYQGKINSNRLEHQWYGESKPDVENLKPDGSDNPEGRDLNRRTEFTVIGYLEKK